MFGQWAEKISGIEKSLRVVKISGGKLPIEVGFNMLRIVNLRLFLVGEWFLCHRNAHDECFLSQIFAPLNIDRGSSLGH